MTKSKSKDPAVWKSQNKKQVDKYIITMAGTRGASAPRRSGRERKQVESVYTDAKKVVDAEKKKKKNKSARERGSR
jgi:hypothetical protein